MMLAGCAGKKPRVIDPIPQPTIQAPAPLTTAPVTPPTTPIAYPTPPGASSPTSPTSPLVTTAAPPRAQRYTFASIPGWVEGDHAPVLASLKTACPKIRGGANDSSIGGLKLDGQPIFGTGADWAPICDAAASTPSSGARDFFERWFEPVSVNGAGEAGASLFTAYYEPELLGSRQRGGIYQHPLYRKPRDLQRGVPYYDRAAIDKGALAGRGLELFWLADPVESFFLHIQGSGRIRLPDGRVARVGYAGKNGHPYRAIGRVLVNSGEMTLEEVSTQSIKQWIKANPHRRDELFAANPSYVFFIERPGLALDPSLGPVGTFGVPIPAMRGIAVDRRTYPLGIPFWVDFDTPVGPMQRLTIALDTGGAIKGSGRADFFFGSGDGAGEAAGATRSMGRLTALAPTSALRRVFQAGS